MAQNRNPRRFYIDHGDDQPIVRSVPVRRVAPSPPVPPAAESVPTHQAAPSDTPDLVARSLREKARLTPRAVSRLMHSARKRSQSPRS